MPRPSAHMPSFAYAGACAVPQLPNAENAELRPNCQAKWRGAEEYRGVTCSNAQDHAAIDGLDHSKISQRVVSTGNTRILKFMKHLKLFFSGSSGALIRQFRGSGPRLEGGWLSSKALACMSAGVSNPRPLLLPMSLNTGCLSAWVLKQVVRSNNCHIKYMYLCAISSGARLRAARQTDTRADTGIQGWRDSWFMKLPCKAFKVLH